MLPSKFVLARLGRFHFGVRCFSVSLLKRKIQFLKVFKY